MPSGKHSAPARHPPHGAQAGVAYLGLLMAVVLFGLGVVGTARLLASTQRADKERELLYIGHQFRDAIRSYYASGPATGQFPPTLEDLLIDKRSPTLRRHLRKIYLDPLTGKPTWGLVKAPGGGIMGVYSLSKREPLKRAKFEPEDADIELAVQNKLKSLALAPGSAASAPAAPASAASSPFSLSPMTGSTLKLTALSAMTTELDGESSETPGYSYKDWKFVYRPQSLGGTGGNTRPMTGG